MLYVVLKNAPFITYFLNAHIHSRIFTWRHDSALSLIGQALCSHVEYMNSLQPKAVKSMSIAFVKADTAPDKTHTSKKDGHVHMLSKANDWKLLVDLLGSNYVFPPAVCSTA